MGHHHHNHGDRQTGRRRLAFTLALVLLYMVAEVVGGLWTGSLALLADAGHMLSDAAALGLALFALWIAERPGGPQRTFGFRRTEVLAALANGATLLLVAVFIALEAWERFQAPQEVKGREMMLIAVGGLVINLVGLFVLHGSRSHSLNLRGAWLHVLADTLGSVQAIAAGALIWAFGWHWADPLASVLIAALVIWSAWSLLRDSLNVLMEATPPHIDAEEVRAALTAVPGIREVHDLHIWTITSGFESLSVHARVAEGDRDEILRQAGELLRERFGIEHTTVQLEGAAGEEDCGAGGCD
jgi:cobalt-zinc-cadmium efflux system protein